MKTDKEYPATHSMDTSWFAVDADGYVAIMQCGLDGPAPVSCPDVAGYDNSLYIALGLRWESDIVINTFNLTEEQVDLLMTHSVTGYEYYEMYKGDNMWLDSNHYVIVEIDRSRKDELFNIVKMHKENQAICLSNERCIYAIDLEANDIHMESEDESKISDKLWLAYIHLYKNGIVKRVICYEEFDDPDRPCARYEGHDACCFMRDIPFYLYNHPDYADDLFTCENKPQKPVHISQLIEGNLIVSERLPIRFSDTPKIQLAEFIACEVYRHVVEIDGEEYFMARFADGKYYFVPYRRKGKSIPATDDDVKEYYK